MFTVGVLSGALTLGGMEVGACRLARVLADLGYSVWLAYQGLEQAEAHEIGRFVAQEGLEITPWSDVRHVLETTNVLWVSQGGFVRDDAMVAAMNAVPFSFEYQGQPANVVPPQQAFCPTWFVNKTRSLHAEMKRRRQMDAGHLCIPGIPVLIPDQVARAQSDPPMFLSMCRMVDWQKRLSVVIEAAHLLARAGRRFRLVLAGDGPDRSMYAQMARGAPYIEFPGWVSGEQRDALIRECAAYVMPSLWEGSSRSLREMMAAEVPVITGMGGGTRELVASGEHVLGMEITGDPAANRTREAEAGASLMAAIMDNPGAAAEMAARARAQVIRLNKRATDQIARWMRAIATGRLRPVGEIAISVVMPAWNAADTLEAAVASVQRQVDAPPWELIIVDDGSTDGTGELAEKLAASEARITVIHHRRNLGVNAARNSAARAARGVALLPLDADDELLGSLGEDGRVLAYNWLAKAWAAFEAGGREVMVYGRTIRYVPTNWEKGSPVYDEKGAHICNVIRPPTYIESVKQLMGGDFQAKTLLPTVLHPRLGWAQVGGWGWEGGRQGGVGRGLEDTVYNIELLLLGYQLSYVDDIYYHWRHRHDSRSSKMDFRVEWAAVKRAYSPRLMEAGYGL